MNEVNHSDINLAGRRVLVTGGARGLGESFARALLAAGARVVISDVLHERGAALAAELGPDLHYLPMDLSDPAAIRAGVDADMVNLARSFSATRWQVFRNIEYPTTLPALFSGLRIASTLAVIGVVVGELVGGNMGLGYMLVFFEGQGNTAGVFVIIGALTVIGIVAYYAVVLAERRVLHYLPGPDSRSA